MMSITNNAFWRRTGYYRRWRKAVIERDTRCVICSSIHDLQAHHLEHGSHNKKLRFTVSNGVTLCYGCHMNFHCNFLRSYRVKCTKYDFENFKVLHKYFMSIV